ncbi:unnamed protein product [Rotaria magnacalcarata]|uniref:Aminotransferase class V domain-containing protein n=1 Tax=Rotaria magnacalcarata TaxID=392030 RepID=A0A820D472_9BILA|nr:unnamed protein product [Rotaria magnacalcarata]
MAHSPDQTIEYFQSLTNWNDRQAVIEFLEMYEWDVSFAIEAFLTECERVTNVKPKTPTLLRTISTEVGIRYSSTNDNSTQQEAISENHHQLISSFRNRNDSNHTTTTLNIESSDDQVHQLFASNTETASSIFPYIKQFDMSKQPLLQYIDSNVIGSNHRINTPWGSRKILYADYTASERGLTFIEHFMMNNVLPYYANTHSENNACALQTTKYREGSRTLIKRCILIAKKKLFTNEVPGDCGGGTVNFVTRTQTEYVQDIETREEGGTPNILGSIRAGLVFHLKESVGCHTIETREDALVEKFFARFRNHRTLFVLGSSTVARLGIFSFLIYVPSIQKYLHHNFICVLLNDLFGIQVRSGCSCAGPYVLDLLNINDETADIYAKFITANENDRLGEIPRIELMKPGFTRFNLSYFASDKEVDYILNAIEFIATDGWKFLSLYTYNPETAVWRARSMSSQNNLSQYHSLRMISFENDTPLNIPDEYKDFIWFAIPIDVIRKIIIDFEQNGSRTVPFRPNSDN